MSALANGMVTEPCVNQNFQKLTYRLVLYRKGIKYLETLIEYAFSCNILFKYCYI